VSETNPYDEAEAGWRDLIAAAERILAAAQQIKQGENSIDGYEIERAVKKHKLDMMRKHLDGLRQHRADNRL
jgi:hypothetical protein